MFWKIVLRGNNPSGRVLAVLCARTGETIDVVRELLNSSQGIVLQSGLTREKADLLSSELPGDGSVDIIIQRDEVVCIPVLMGYRPGSRGRLRVALQKLSSLPTEEVIHFLTCIPIALKSDADRATAESIKKILEKAGGIIEIRSPNDLVGVASRNTRSRASSRPVTKEVKPVKAACLSKTDSDHHYVKAGSTEQKSVSSKIPPVFSTTDFVYTVPHVFQCVSPSYAGETGIPLPPVRRSAAKEVVYTPPSLIRFTLPPVSIPPVIGFSRQLSIAPSVIESSGTIFIYLFPVSSSSEEEKRVQGVLCRFLGLSPARVYQIIKSAPVALAGFSERIDALVAIKELTGLGIPVSLVKGSSVNSQNPAGRSFFGWLNGHGRIH